MADDLSYHMFVKSETGVSVLFKESINPPTLFSEAMAHYCDKPAGK